MKSIDSDNIKREIRKTIVGQDSIIDLLLITVIAGGHALLEGVPGLAKTLLINSLARTLDLSFNRIQFTPDLVPSDIIGTEIIDFSQKGSKDFQFVKGALFAHIVLADEINRTPPKTQSALLQAMQEKQVTVLGKTYPLELPFFVFATQNPIEYEGTYPLPEAQLDRFLLHIDIGYPDEREEMKIIDSKPSNIENIVPVIDRKGILGMMDKAEKIPVSDKVKNYIITLTRNSRPDSTEFDFIKKYVEWGAGPRASQMLLRAAKAHAYLNNKKIADKEDVDFVLIPGLKHRIILSYNTMAEGISVRTILEDLKKSVEVKI